MEIVVANVAPVAGLLIEAAAVAIICTFLDYFLERDLERAEPESRFAATPASRPSEGRHHHA